MYWLTGILGATSIVAPLVFGYTSHNGVLWTNIIAGILLIVVSILEGLAEDRQEWEYVAVMILGVVILVAPFFWVLAQLQKPW